MTAQEKAIEEILLNGSLESAFSLLKNGIKAEEIKLDGVNIVTGSILANAKCETCLNLLKQASETITKAEFSVLILQEAVVLTPLQAAALNSRGIEITKEIEKKYAKKTNALILCAQYKPFDFLCKVLEFVCIEKKVKLPQNIIQDLRKTALAREIFCSEREIDELFTKCGLTNKNKLYTI